MTRYALFLGLALQAALVPVPLAADLLATPAAPAPPTASGAAAAFLADYDFEVTIDGKISPDVVVWSSATLPGKLLIGAPVGGAVFIRLADRKVVPVNPARIRVLGDRMSVDADAYGETLTEWTIEEGGAAFTSDGKKVRVETRPIFVGECTLEAILDKTPAYRHLMGLYEPDRDALQYLKQYQGDVSIEVFFGSWCHVCKQYLPQFLKTVTDCANPKLQVKMFGLPRDFTTDERVTARQVKGIPCIILYKQGQEIGRIEGPPRDSYEKDLGGFLRLAASNKG